MQYEENPFEDPQVAKEWINSVENEQGMIRDREIYPFLKSWVRDISPKFVVEIGSGQGICSSKIDLGEGRYLGVEPSQPLVRRANELYKDKKKEFVVGNAYELPLPDEAVDAVFSVNVWFHLEKLDEASSELSRALKLDGKFLIITANPSWYDVWESFYFDQKKDEGKIVGKVNVPVNPMSKSTFYLHSLENIKKSLEENGLCIDEIREIGDFGGGQNIFIAINGQKLKKINNKPAS
ncbi:MAG: class I SAM-dependent methyltransferase [Candidatus Paceibacterota bacterium]|jgi:ubiquinone/menaquinone biosynthesis C-methylase UbiE